MGLLPSFLVSSKIHSFKVHYNSILICKTFQGYHALYTAVPTVNKLNFACNYRLQFSSRHIESEKVYLPNNSVKIRGKIFEVEKKTTIEFSPSFLFICINERNNLFYIQTVLLLMLLEQSNSIKLIQDKRSQPPLQTNFFYF